MGAVSLRAVSESKKKLQLLQTMERRMLEIQRARQAFERKKCNKSVSPKRSEPRKEPEPSPRDDEPSLAQFGEATSVFLTQLPMQHKRHHVHKSRHAVSASSGEAASLSPPKQTHGNHHYHGKRVKQPHRHVPYELLVDDATAV
ncbi:hypothetical protein SPRG_13169 [Saprolegnia parasitica CBS 223.65]|uniref:Uncharacterized protein n=1 Tax=Saprolegnia parasitica (strain CBS 223.65) TaxID=695850 RepID=A0A067BTD1_SAPPC|nr:hypothetical protein SPRG_13169 [Saprolegnia parasitica CBS 223.65]KDO21754.1 hypothetical protein SPRG_13169 [Saprolegnia parasitica CBS 223.65]|eukprot:XP_012207555.1 hypothetical protein SPRG_13169 [Saprolegnia parasitica CBS 223.65]